MVLLDHRINRRALVSAAAAISAAGFVTPHPQVLASATPTPSLLPVELPNGGIQPDGSWQFTDDRGVTATLPATPARVIAYVGIASALYDFGFEVVGYFGGATSEGGEPAIIAGDLPLDRIPSFGSAGELDIEKLIELRPDLVIGMNYDLTESRVIWPFDDVTRSRVEQIAPVLAFAGGDGADVQRTIETIANLAAALGVDPATTEFALAKADFESALNDLSAVIAEKPDLTTLFVSASDTGFWIGKGLSDITLFERLGLKTLNEPIWEEKSWERWLDYPCDLLLIDARGPGWWQRDQLEAGIPVFAKHPAVEADQVASWRVEFVPSYQGFTPILQELTGAIRNANPGIA
jgi:iron complex transport system substrate-binding protein